MSQKSGITKLSSERIVKDIRRATRKQYSAEERIDPHRAGRAARRAQHREVVPARRHCREPVLHLVEGVPGGWQTAPCGRHRAGGDQRRKDLRRKVRALKDVVAEQALELRLLKKSMIVDGDSEE